MVSAHDDPELARLARDADSVLDSEGWAAQVMGFSRRGDGRQVVLRLHLDGRAVGIKLYGRKRSSLRTWVRQLGHWVYLRRSGLSASSRYRTERETLALWTREGFRVPRVLEIDKPGGLDAEYRGRFDRGLRCLILEWLEGPALHSALPKGELKPKAERWLREFAAETGRRHRRALELGEPALLHQHPILEHVRRIDGGFAHLDLELVSTRRRGLRSQVRREVLGWIRSIWQSTLSAKSVGVFCEAYPDQEIIQELVHSRVEGLVAWVEACVLGLGVVRRRRPGRRELRAILRESMPGEAIR